MNTNRVRANKIPDFTKMFARSSQDKLCELKKANKTPEMTEMFAPTGLARVKIETAW